MSWDRILPVHRNTLWRQSLSGSSFSCVTGRIDLACLVVTVEEGTADTFEVTRTDLILSIEFTWEMVLKW